MNLIQSNDNVEIVAMYCIPYGGSNDMGLRQMEMSFDIRDQNKLQSILDSSYNQPITANALTQASPGLVYTSSDVHGLAKIQNGWQSKRFRFILVTRTKQYSKQGSYPKYVYEIYQGYTDKLEVFGVQGDEIAPDTEFLINSVTTLIQSKDDTGYSYNTPLTSFNVMMDPQTNSLSFINDETGNKYICRPTDVFDSLSSREAIDQGIQIESSLNVLSTNPQESTIGNSIPLVHLAKTINACKKGEETGGIGYNDFSLWDVSNDVVYENRLSDLNFINLLSTFEGVPLVPTSFILEELDYISPDYELVKTRQSKGVRLDNIGRGDLDASDPNAATINATVASVSTIGLGSILMDNFLSTLILSATNRTTDGSVVTTILNHTPLIPGDNSNNGAIRASNDFERLIYPVITRGGVIDIDLKISMILSGDSLIEVSIQGEPPEPFVIPTLANSTFNNLTMGYEAYENLIDGYSSVLDMTRDTRPKIISSATEFKNRNNFSSLPPAPPPMEYNGLSGFN